MSGIRVGYVNVRGLSPASWKACHLLLNNHFDYLFIAETWFVNHRTYSRDRRFIASTPPGAKNLQGRQRGGIYLLGSHHARTRARDIHITEHSITFSRERQSFTGVYFPPTTLNVEEMAALLKSLGHSTVILGDINTRFNDPLHQLGEPGPPERLQSFTSFLATTDHQHIKPTESLQKLTTDHCFVRSRQVTVLRLLDNAKLKMDTDHKYTMSLVLGNVEDMAGAGSIRRFRISRMSKPHMREAMLRLIMQHERPFGTTEAIDVMNAKLVALCQHIQERTIGNAHQEENRVVHADQPPVRDQTPAASTRLYKLASQVSDENDVIFPTIEAQSQGIDATTENLGILKQRWSGDAFQSSDRSPDLGEIELWMREDIVEEIIHQEADKSCGADGIHIQFLKTVKDTPIVTWLLELYNHCLDQGRTPRAWNQSEIYLLSKDVRERRDAKNLRPISIICIFRKIFERLLLLKFQGQSWARLHPAQAGFRRSYSTYSNAAVVHAHLASKSTSFAVFLDFKSAFDVLNHQRLDNKLEARGCPASLRPLIQSLMFVHQESRILINGQVTEWFPRSRGVLQGSPLSPWLFNLFIDDLLCEVNSDVKGIPICLFYADDGVIIGDTTTKIHLKLRIVEDWTVRNAIFLNPLKCAVVTSRSDLDSLNVYDQKILHTDDYTYLGFPVSAKGIDFEKHLRQRIEAAVGRTHWLGIQSNSWGPAHRLRIYKQFLAPMFEYGAPLVSAWAVQNLAAFDRATGDFKELMAWISNSANNRYMITANLCGLSALQQRFQRLRTAYQLVIEQMIPESPMKQLLRQPNLGHGASSFIQNLRRDTHFTRFRNNSNFEPTIHIALSRFLRRELVSTIQSESEHSHLTSLVPFHSRRVPGLFMADITLSAPVPKQNMLLQYRRGLFMRRAKCLCGDSFGRGHETCTALKVSRRLSRAEWQEKMKMRRDLSLTGTKFTDIDFLLGAEQVRDAAMILTEIRDQLREEYKRIQTSSQEDAQAKDWRHDDAL
jgi:hypothetical protein